MHRCLPILCLFALAACSGKPPEPEARAASAASTPFESMQAAKRHAAEVQHAVDERAAAERRTIEADTQ